MRKSKPMNDKCFLEYGDKKIELKLSVPAVILAEEKLNGSLVTFMEDIQRMKFSTITVILWASALREIPGTSFNEFAENLDLSHTKDYVEMCGKLLARAFNIDEDDSKNAESLINGDGAK